MRHRSEPERHRRSRIDRAATAILASVATFAPSTAEGQVVQLLQAVGDGGSWVNLSVEKGRAVYSSPVLPLAGLSVDGCLRVWKGHSGSWTVRAKDTVGGRELGVRMRPGEPAKFDYKAGLRAQLDLEVQWSEPRDTTLFMWVGLSPAHRGEKGGRDICEPPAGDR